MTRRSQHRTDEVPDGVLAGSVAMSLAAKAAAFYEHRLGVASADSRSLSRHQAATTRSDMTQLGRSGAHCWIGAALTHKREQGQPTAMPVAFEPRPARAHVSGRCVSGYFGHSLDAYGRQGKSCRRCGTLIIREQFTNRSSRFCPTCQKQPRPLAGS